VVEKKTDKDMAINIAYCLSRFSIF